MKQFTFRVELIGYGETAKDAWFDAENAIIENGLGWFEPLSVVAEEEVD